ncbi:site-specific integrase [Rarobacter faecitabidus]|uniref:Site-specific recombinase XerD n=1 Tax=Rarobacter faecitabidus TaxID=13243 RepID=A0A542ZE40_RARFA|nr:site-specific integrase [Rarobacter faecitabidus]TQL58561.1 site-specific recombinase XerD [Rarobacter faecitabidus]
MAWTRKLPSGKHQALYRGPDGKVRTVTGGPFVHKAAADRAGAAAEAESRHAGWRDPEASRKTWGEWCAAWWPTRTVAPSTLRTDEGRRDTHLLPRWADTPLCDITRHDIVAWAAHLRLGDTKTGRKPVASETVKRIVHLFSASLNGAIDAEILTTNPAARLKFGGGHVRHGTYLTRAQYADVRKHLDPRWHLVADLLVGTGMRWGEATGLHHARVDHQRRTLEVIDVWQQSGRTMKPYPKGKKPRTVPIPPWIDLPAATTGTCGYSHDTGICHSPLLLTTPNGAILDQSRFRTALNNACDKAEIPHIRIHDLRHTYASWLIQDGISLSDVGKLLGHTSPLTTERYKHLQDEVPDTVTRSLANDPRQAASATPVMERAARRGLRIVHGGA